MSTLFQFSKHMFNNCTLKRIHHRPKHLIRYVHTGLGGSDMKTINSMRVRFAPSPTGSLHIGGARTAIYNWLLAQKSGGDMIIRIEDTDEKRSSMESEFSILSDLRWLGLTWKEGPDVGGPHGPYRQSQRKDLYMQHALRLIEEEKAYRCFCADDSLVQKKEITIENAGEEAKYDGRWRNADPAEVQRRLDNNEPYTVRFCVPRGRKVALQDAVFGEVIWDTDTFLDDFIILRSNGMPVYNFCVAVDDIDMRISHVVRAQEHLTNTLKQLLLIEALGQTPPTYAHCSILLGSDGTKLSKRNGAASVGQYREEGYLAEALLGYLGGFKPATVAKSTKLVKAPSEVIAEFTIDRIQRNASKFDLDYLQFLNREHLRALPLTDVQRLVGERLTKESSATDPTGVLTVLPSIVSPNSNLSGSDLPVAVTDFLAAASKIAQRDMVLVSDASRLVGHCLRYELAHSISSDPHVAQMMTDPVFVSVVRALVRDFEGGALPQGSESDMPQRWKTYTAGLMAELGVKGKTFFHPLRVCITGCVSGPEIADNVRLVGLAACDEVRRILNPAYPTVLLPDRIQILKELCLPAV